MSNMSTVSNTKIKQKCNITAIASVTRTEFNYRKSVMDQKYHCISTLMGHCAVALTERMGPVGVIQRYTAAFSGCGGSQ